MLEAAQRRAKRACARRAIPAGDVWTWLDAIESRLDSGDGLGHWASAKFNRPTRSEHLVGQQFVQVASIAVLGHGSGEGVQGVVVAPGLAPGDFLGAGDLEALAVFDGLDELAGFQQAVVGAGVEPGIAAAQVFDMQPFLVQIEPVEVGDLQLAARRRADLFGQVHHLFIEEVESGDGVARFGLGRFSSRLKTRPSAVNSAMP